MAFKKPVKHKIEYYDYNEVASYLQQLHKKDFRDYAGKYAGKFNNVPYQDFWHWLCDLNGEVSNGGEIHLPDFVYYMKDSKTEPWKKEIMRYFMDFLGDEYDKPMRASW